MQEETFGLSSYAFWEISKETKLSTLREIEWNTKKENKIINNNLKFKEN